MSSTGRSRRQAAISESASLGERLIRRLGRPFAASAVFGAVFAPSVAAAQSANDDVATVTFEMQARYDSNIARSSDARANVRGLEKSDYRLSPTVRVDFARNFGRTRATLAGSVAYDFFARNDQLNRERIALDGGAATQLGLCTPSAGFSLSRGQSDLGDIAFVGGAPLVAVKNTQTFQRYSAELACGDQYGLRPFGGIEYERGDNSNATRQRADFDATRYSTGLRYVSPTIGEISLFASQRNVDLKGPRLPGEAREYRQTNYGVGLSREIGTRFQGSAQVAFSDVDNGAARGGFDGLTWNFSLAAIVGPRTRIEASTGRDISNNLSSDATLVVRTPYSLRATYAVNERIQANAGISIVRQRYKYSIVPAALVFIQKDRREIYDAGVSYRFARRLSLGLSAGHERRRADEPFFNFKNTFATLSVGFTL